MKRISIFYSIAALVVAFTNHSCTPVFSEFQSARTVGEGNLEVTSSYSSANVYIDGEPEPVQNQIGLQVAYGISEKLDLRLRYEFVWGKDTDNLDGVSVLGIGPKYSIVKNKIAVALPMGKAFGEGFRKSWQMHPTVLLTLPLIKDKLDVTLGPKYLLSLCDGCDDFYAMNLGFSISNDLSTWSIRPEFGLLREVGESGYASHFGIAISTLLGRVK